MAKSKNDLVDFDRVRSSHLDQLVALGYGKDQPEVVNYLVARGLDDLVRCGVISAPVAAQRAAEDVRHEPA